MIIFCRVAKLLFGSTDIRILLVAFMTHFIVKRIEMVHDKSLTDLAGSLRDLMRAWFSCSYGRGGFCPSHLERGDPTQTGTGHRATQITRPDMD